MTIFHLTKDIKIGYNSYEDYDKLSMIVIYLGEHSSENDLLRLIELLFTSELDTNEIINALYDEFNIQTDELFVKEVQEMCNLSDLIEERGIKKGIKKGVEQGFELGKINTIIENVKNLMENTNFSFEQAIEILKVPEELIERCQQALN